MPLLYTVQLPCRRPEWGEPPASDSRRVSCASTQILRVVMSSGILFAIAFLQIQYPIVLLPSTRGVPVQGTFAALVKRCGR
ncbi:MAG: hypothetical protein ACUVR7_14230 [Armatimonadota bacterium]